MNLTLYQTLADRSNPEYIESEGPFKCKQTNAWLGTGYYFWDGHIQLAHFWGNGMPKGYIICRAEAVLDDSCWDLHSNSNHRIEFEAILDLIISSNITLNTPTVGQVIEYLKSHKQFAYEAIRILGMHSISSKMENPAFVRRIPFIKNNYQYFDIYPPVQICLLHKKALSLRNFFIVYPNEYVNDIYA